MLPSSRQVAAALCVLLAAAGGRAAAAGQGQPPRGTFGPSNAASISSRPSVDLIVEGYQGRGQNQTRGGEGGDQATLEDKRFYTGMVTRFAFRKRAQRVTFTADAADSSRYYGGAGLTSLERHARVNLDARPGRRTQVRATASAMATPLLVLMAVPNAGDQPGTWAGTDSQVHSESASSYTAAAGLTRQINQRSEMSFDIGAEIGGYAGAAHMTSSKQAGAIYTRRLTHGLAVKLGDTVRVLQSTNGERVTVQDIAAGFDLSKALAWSRHTKLTFKTGSAIAASELGRHYGAIGEAQLTHQFTGTWATTGTFDRSLRVVEFLPGPFLANSSTAVLNGTLGRRLALLMRGAYSFGDVDLETGPAARYSSVLSAMRLSQVMGRHMQFYAEYQYSEYRFPLAIVLPAGVPHRRIQHGARIGINLWAPLARTAR